MSLENIWLLPVFTAFYSILTPLLCYSFAYYHGRVPARWPYLSEIATHPPERCIYAMMTNHLTILIPIWVYIKHRTLVSYFEQNGLTKYRPMSTVLFVLGLTSALALQIATNFPRDKVPYVQAIGYLVLTFACIQYVWLNTVLSLLIQDRFLPRWHLFVVRAFLCTVITSLALHIAKVLLFDAVSPEEKEKELKSGSWGIAAEMEWGVFISASLFLLTDSWELSAVRVRSPKLVIPGTPLYEETRMGRRRVTTCSNEETTEAFIRQPLVL